MTRRAVFATQLAVVFVALAGVADLARAQGNVSTLGQGYPPGQLSTRDLGSGGAFGEIDAESPINPAALGAWGTIGLHFQYDPEFRTVTANGVTERTTTNRFPVLVGAIPIGHFTVGLSFSTLLDRTWETNVTKPLNPKIGDSASTSRRRCARRVASTTCAWVSPGRPRRGWRSAPGWTGSRARTRSSNKSRFRTRSRTSISRRRFSSPSATAGWGRRWLHPEADPTLVARRVVPGRRQHPRASRRFHHAGEWQHSGAGGRVIAFTGIPGVALGARVDWEQWSKLNDLSVGDVTAKNGLGWSGGADIQAFRLFDRTIQLRMAEAGGPSRMWSVGSRSTRPT